MEMYESKISSNNLYHFTKKPNTIKSILENGFYPRTSIEDFTFLMPNYENEKSKALIGVPMVCFCDIPLNLIENHVNDYGKYGIGLSKEWGIKNGLHPVTYIIDKKLPQIDNNDTSMKDILVNMEKIMIDNANNPKKTEEITIAFWNLAGYFKPYTEDYSEKSYYDEREWRYLIKFYSGCVQHEEKVSNRYIIPISKVKQCIPSCNNFRDLILCLLKDTDIDRGIKLLNERIEKDFKLKFDVDDIKEIIVQDKDKKRKIKKIIGILEKICGNNIKDEDVENLKGKIKSLDE